MHHANVNLMDRLPMNAGAAVGAGNVRTNHCRGAGYDSGSTCQRLLQPAGFCRSCRQNHAERRI